MYHTIPELLEELRQGRMVIVVDDEERENEGDLIMAAECVRPEDINFMARFARGLICLTLTEEHCKKLHLPLMVSATGSQRSTNFTVSIEAAKGVTTGISAADRATTILAAVAKDAGPKDITQPGHVFPLMAQPGGVLTRAGHTETGCDLARLAGFTPAAVIVEILNEDGSMARRQDLQAFAKQHGLKMGTIADLIHYRLLHEATVTRVLQKSIQTDYGPFELYVYSDVRSSQYHLALVKGKVVPKTPALVRVHVMEVMNDLLHVTRAHPSYPRDKALARLAKEETAVLVLLAQQETPKEWLSRLQSDALASWESDELRVIGPGSQILRDLGVQTMRLLGAPKKLHGLSGFGLEVEGYEPYE